ncbi:FAD:protein FMN transferase [Sphingomonas phyllosphaerae]|uniref:FAD:protein FMN transferase n=1 Tax=Sphingomonas phyllosphaerae TaxID=257003 RepID=UPI002FF783D3
MGTRIELHRFGDGAPDALTLAQRAIEQVDDALTIHRPSPATALNEVLRGGGPAKIDDPILFDALVQIDDARATTEGLFDPAVDRRLVTSGWPQLRFDRHAATLACDAPVALDFGGFGKGYALDRAILALREAGVECALLSAGESSIAVIGAHPLGGAWSFTVPDPRNGADALVEVELIDEALSISSTLGVGVAAPERAAMLRPGRKEAIVAPRTAVVVDRSGAIAEMLSTALIVADDAAARRLHDGVRRMLFDLAPAAPIRMFA